MTESRARCQRSAVGFRRFSPPPFQSGDAHKMSIMTPHIRVLLAEAGALNAEAQSLAGSIEAITAAYVLVGMAAAKLEAARSLKAEDEEIRNRLFLIPARDQK